MIRRPPRSTRTDTLFPYTTLFRSLPPCRRLVHRLAGRGRASRRSVDPDAGVLLAVLLERPRSRGAAAAAFLVETIAGEHHRRRRRRPAGPRRYLPRSSVYHRPPSPARPSGPLRPPLFPTAAPTFALP